MKTTVARALSFRYYIPYTYSVDSADIAYIWHIHTYCVYFGEDLVFALLSNTLVYSLALNCVNNGNWQL